jgi:very-short-patch-repair endonuclease
MKWCPAVSDPASPVSTAPAFAARAADLFTYLEEFAKLRSTVVRDFAHYEASLLLAEFHGANGCRGPLLDPDPVLEWGSPWLAVSRPRKATNPPDLPNVFAGYVLDEAKTPAWSPPLEPPAFEADPGETAPDPADPAVIAAWQDWREAWIDWATRELPHHRARQVYQRLFAMRTRQERMGEQFELIAGLGLLSWETPTGQRVRRHLIAIPASLAFEDDSGTITLSPSGGGKPLMLETEMLELDQRPSEADTRQIETALLDAPTTEDATPILATALRRWATQATVHGTFEPMIEPGPVTTTPVVAWAPGIILRRRGGQTLQKQFAQIRELIEGGGEIPGNIHRLISVMDDWQRDDAASAERDPGSAPRAAGYGAAGSQRVATALDDAELFFPLAANDEQRQIAQRLRTRQGVLVQGPPGTGKSHTIANLLCHLLVTGNRVLVTSHTARALTVLHDKLPPEVAALCVSLLGQDQAAARHLESVVRGITQRQEQWTAGGERENHAEIARLEARLDELRRDQARRISVLRDRRQKAAEQRRKPAPGYTGTPTDIAQKVAEQAAEFSWLADRIDPAAEPPSGARVLAVLEALRAGTLDAVLPELPIAPDDLPSRELVAMKIAAQQDAAMRRDALQGGAMEPRFPLVRALTVGQRLDLATLLNDLQSHLQQVEREGQPWMLAALGDLLHGRGADWRDLAEQTDLILRTFSNDWNPPAISGHGKRSNAEVMADARALKAHLDTGGDLGIMGPFRPKPVKNGWYLIDGATFDGRGCGNPEVLGSLIFSLETRERFDRIQRRWAGHEPITGDRYGLRRAAMAESRQRLEQVLAAAEIALKIRDLRGMESLPGEDLASPSALASLREAVNAAEAESDLEWARDELARLHDALDAAIDVPDIHPAYTEARDALERLDADAWGAARDALAVAAEEHAERARLSDLLRRLGATAPRFARDLATNPGDPAWQSRIADMTAAWNWSRARRWLANLPETDEHAEREQISAIEQEIGEVLADLAAARAWRSCLSAMTEEQRQHLIAWQAAVTRAGRQTGKYAGEHLRAARSHLEGCRDAIPAWIMPLYKVAETIVPTPGIFDVAIIDEASQSGPEALLLAFLARKLVVVGDDKQISPSNVGIVGDDVFALQRAYLKDVPQADALGLGSSFFDICSILFAGRITLREHFRSMPEIIEFSNRHFYRDTPLIPLRQYGQERLDPLVTLHVPDGYEKGNANRPEAEAIVERIAACVDDPAYAGRTMGVISLKGDDQAKLIESMLLSRLDPRELEARRIVCGDAYAFQGDERDVMFLSMVKAPRTDDRTLTAVRDNQTRRRFNVAASRARDQLVLAHTATLDDFPATDDLRRMLLAYMLEPAGATLIPGEPPCKEGRFDSAFEQAVCERIWARGYRVIPQVKVGQFRIDLVVEGRTRRLAIECDGDHWHGPDRFEEDMARQRALERCGWTFWRVRGSQFYQDPESALAPLWPLLERHGIAPNSAQSDAPDTRAESDSAPDPTREQPSTDEPPQPRPDSNLDRDPDPDSPQRINRYCTRCGLETASGTRFCGSCGQSLIARGL